MAILKCKMCGGSLNLGEQNSTAVCEYCGTLQTVPNVDDERKLTLFNRANRLRLDCEFDKAAGIYETIVADFAEEAEAYWGLVLCKYGIEYVDDPRTGNKVPTCHRSSFDDVLQDRNFTLVQQCADVVARKIYCKEANQIEELRKGIIAVSSKEEPYDVFICYKETTDSGDRTIDSVLAQDVYNALTEKHYRVFFSRITLEDRLGREYEPYIFAALNSAKVMLVFGTDPEHFQAVWVKNEWSRYLQLMTEDKAKHLIPCFKDIDPYDMPREFTKLQAQDMGKVGAVQDLLRGIEKLLPRQGAETPQPTIQQVIQTGGVNTSALLERGNNALEDRNWEAARDFFDRVLDQDAQCAEAYLGCVLCENQEENLQGWEDMLCKKYQNPTLEKYQAGRRNEQWENEFVQSNALGSYLTENELWQILEFDFSYSSTVSGWKIISKTVTTHLATDKNLQRALKYAKGDFKVKLEQSLDNIEKKYQAKIAYAEERDKGTTKRILDRYEKHLFDCEEKAVALRDGAMKKCATEYGQANREFQKGEYSSAQGHYMHCAAIHYKDSSKQVAECRRRIQKIEELKKPIAKEIGELTREKERLVEKRKKWGERRPRKDDFGGACWCLLIPLLWPLFPLIEIYYIIKWIVSVIKIKSLTKTIRALDIRIAERTRAHDTVRV